VSRKLARWIVAHRDEGTKDKSMKKPEGEYSTTHQAEEGDRVCFMVQDPDYPKQQNKVEVYEEDGKVVIYCEYAPNITLQASNILSVQPRRKW
jgi:hypothetical protein